MPRHQLKGREGCEKEERDGKGKGEMGREGKVRKDGAGGGEKVEKGKEGSTWIFVEEPRSSCSSYATVESAEAIMHSKSAAAESDELQQLE